MVGQVVLGVTKHSSSKKSSYTIIKLSYLNCYQIMIKCNTMVHILLSIIFINLEYKKQCIEINFTVFYWVTAS